MPVTEAEIDAAAEAIGKYLVPSTAEFVARLALDALHDIPCVACAGTGYYDNDGSPPCEACDGTGKEHANRS